MSERKTDYAIYSLEFCQGQTAPDWFGGVPLFSNQGTTHIPMLYTLLIGGEVGGKQQIALVDCGFRNDHWLNDNSAIFSNWESPGVVLGRLGLRPEDIDVILVSHMHFDHMGNFEAFPNAKLYIQFEEFMGWSRAVNMSNQLETDADRAWILSSFDPTDITRVAKGLAEGRIEFIDGDQELLPGVTAHLARDSHTFGSQWFKVQTQNGPYVIAGDTVYWYANVEKMWAPGYVQGNSFNLVTLYKFLTEDLKRETTRIIPGHDAEIAVRYTSWVTENGNTITEINRLDGEASRAPANAGILLT